MDDNFYAAVKVSIHGLAGSSAAAVSTLLLYPLENIRTRMQLM